MPYLSKPKLLFTFVFALVASYTFSQQPNPFRRIGKKAEVIDISQGRYVEIIEKDSIERIGSVLINRYTRKIERLLDEAPMDTEADNTVQSRFFSVDPIASQFPELSPYQFASNRPIQGIDLDGLEFTTSGFNFDPYQNVMGSDKFSKAEKKEYAKKSAINGAVGLAVVTDIFLTRGRISSTIFSMQLAGAFPHTPASTPEGRAQQEKASKAAFTEAIVGWGVSKIIGTSIRWGLAFSEEVKYLFRGTSEGFPGLRSTQITSSTPTSSDPVVATIFAINSKNYGKGVLQVALPQNLQGVEVGATTNVLGGLEKEIVVGLKPAEFTTKVSYTITADQARGILGEMGIKLPAKISLEEISETIRQTPRLTEKQVNDFFKRVTEIKE